MGDAPGGPRSGPARILVLGVSPEPSPAHHDLVSGADLVVAGRRVLAGLHPPPRRALTVEGDVPAVLDAIAAETGTVCVLASGDPGYFGILRALAAHFERSTLEVRPAPSSVALAFARVALPWDDAVVVSAHGRPLADAVAALLPCGTRGLPKAAVLVSPGSPPQTLAAALVARGAPGAHRAVVCSRLGYPDEAVVDTHLARVAGGRWDPLSVVLLLPSEPVAPAAPRATPQQAAAGPAVVPPGSAPPGSAPPGSAPPARPASQARRGVGSFGRSEGDYEHRAGMITKPEVRAVVLAHLRLPPAGVLWDVGAGSGSVAVEASGLAPGLEVLAVERDADLARLVALNAARHAVGVEVVEGEAPGALRGLPDPDRVFVGGGGPAVLDAVLARLRPGGRVVATFAALDRAAAAADRLGQLVQMSCARGVRLPDGGLRLVAANPVFVVWGPEP